MSKPSWVMVCLTTYKNLKLIINLNQIKNGARDEGLRMPVGGVTSPSAQTNNK